jgi:hypothetical protein
MSTFYVCIPKFHGKSIFLHMTQNASVFREQIEHQMYARHFFYQSFDT